MWRYIKDGKIDCPRFKQNVESSLCEGCKVCVRQQPIRDRNDCQFPVKPQEDKEVE